MAWGRRCDLGCESWPDEAVYCQCPQCGEPTKRFKNLTPLEDDEAQSILLHIQFDRYYEKRCARLGVPVEGPLPERKQDPGWRSVQRPPSPPSKGGAQRAAA